LGIDFNMRLHSVCFQQQFQSGQVCLLMLFQLLANKSLGQLKKPPNSTWPEKVSKVPLSCASSLIVLS
jgi:hypothetical protein